MPKTKPPMVSRGLLKTCDPRLFGDGGGSLNQQPTQPHTPRRNMALDQYTPESTPGNGVSLEGNEPQQGFTTRKPYQKTKL